MGASSRGWSRPSPEGCILSIAAPYWDGAEPHCLLCLDALRMDTLPSLPPMLAAPTISSALAMARFSPCPSSPRLAAGSLGGLAPAHSCLGLCCSGCWHGSTDPQLWAVLHRHVLLQNITLLASLPLWGCQWVTAPRDPHVRGDSQVLTAVRAHQFRTISIAVPPAVMEMQW